MATYTYYTLVSTLTLALFVWYVSTLDPNYLIILNTAPMFVVLVLFFEAQSQILRLLSSLIVMSILRTVLYMLRACVTQRRFAYVQGARSSSTFSCTL